METWEEINNNFIPTDKYQATVKNGEDLGLCIHLEGNHHEVNIHFGVISALRMLDEGIILLDLFSEDAIMKHQKNGFSSIVYKVINGQFGKSIQSMSGELYNYLGLKHFVIVTLNYVIEVVSKYEPNIAVIKK